MTEDGSLTLADEAALVEFKRAMQEEVIPEIVRVVQMRQELAQESRQWIVDG